MSQGDAFDLLRFLREQWDREEMLAAEVGRPHGDAEGVPVPEHWDITAKRGMVIEILNAAATIDGEWGCGHEADELREHCTDLATMTFLMDALTPWAQAYRDHPGFHPAWKMEYPR